jgi:hypothetical protein
MNDVPPPQGAAEYVKSERFTPAGEPADDFKLHWHGDPYDAPLKEWLVQDMLPKVGVALLSGQWGTFKTFVAFDLCAAIMARTCFAARNVCRQGGVLWFALEGQDDVPIRLEAIVQEKITTAGVADEGLDPSHLPFAWLGSCPKLSAPDAFKKLEKIVAVAAAGVKERSGLDLALVVIDTLSPAAEFKNADDTAENQRVMNVLTTLAQKFQLLVLCVDHFGKDAATGTRNSSVKEATAEAVLATLGDRDVTGNVTNPRLALRKVRGAAGGQQISFNKRVVTLRDHQSANEYTTLVIDWASGFGEPAEANAKKARWPKSLTIFKRALDAALCQFGQRIRPYTEGPEVLAVKRETVRQEFFGTYTADTQKAKGEAFRRCERDAIARDMIASRTVGSDATSTIFWLVADEAPQP